MHPERYSPTAVTAAGAALFVQTLGIVGFVVKLIFNPNVKEKAECVAPQLKSSKRDNVLPGLKTSSIKRQRSVRHEQRAA